MGSKIGSLWIICEGVFCMFCYFSIFLHLIKTRLMKTERIFVITTLFIMAVIAPAEEWKPAEWPVLKHYDSAHLRQIALPLGGIGTGTVSLGGRLPC